MAKLEAEKEELQKNLEAMDQKLFRHAYALAPLAKAEEMKQDYTAYFVLRKEGEEFLTVANNMMEVLAPVFRGETMQVAAITLMINDLKAKHEPGFKVELKKWEERALFEEDQELKKKMAVYHAGNWVYFHNDSFIDVELMDLNTMVQESWTCISNHIFSVFRVITEKQAACVKMKEMAEV